MKKTLFKQSILILSFLFSVGFAFSQAPEKLSYQSVIRRTNNDLVVAVNPNAKVLTVNTVFLSLFCNKPFDFLEF